MSSYDIFTVLSEHTRRDILQALRKGKMSVGDIVDEVGASQPTISKHLKVLRDSGLVAMRADGQRRLYSLSTEPLDELALWLKQFEVVAKPQARKAVDQAAATVGEDEEPIQAQISRTVNRAAEKAADLFAHIPRFGRKKDE